MRRIAWNFAVRICYIDSFSRGSGKGGGGGNFLVRVCEPVFQKSTPFMYLAFEKKPDPFITWSSEMLTIHILPFDLFVPIYCW